MNDFVLYGFTVDGGRFTVDDRWCGHRKAVYRKPSTVFL